MADDRLQIIVGDCRKLLATLPDQSVHCCVTSPPYWGLRDYGHGDQIGLEATPQEYVETMRGVFAEVRRVLRDDGTLWLNLGSSYFGGGGFCPTAPSTATSKSGKYGTAGALIAGHSSGGRRAIQSRQPQRDPAYDSDGTTPQGLRASDCACPDLCDECLADFLSHRDRIVDSSQKPSQSEPLRSLRGHDSEPLDFASASPTVSLPGALESTTLQSWLLHRGACSRCDSRASALSGVRSSGGDVSAFSRMTWLDYTTRLKQKDMVPIPWMVAMALQADGWYLRSDIIWSKPNPMPESVTDRPTKAHEYLFLLSKREKYWYDAEAIKEPTSPNTNLRISQAEVDRIASARANGANTSVGSGRDSAKVHAVDGRVKSNHSFENAVCLPVDTRNKRTVWTVATCPYPEAHFATYPPDLIKPCILAGCPVGGTVLDPFGGSGTTGMVALELGRRAILLEVNPAYADLARSRCDVTPGLPLS